MLFSLVYICIRFMYDIDYFFCKEYLYIKSISFRNIFL